MEERPDPPYVPAPPPAQTLTKDIKELDRILRAFLRAGNNVERLQELSLYMIEDLGMTQRLDSPEARRVLNELYGMLDDFAGDEGDEPLTAARIREYKEAVKTRMETLIGILKDQNKLAQSIKDLASLKQVEKAPFASKGLPEDVVGVIAKNLTGKRGTMDAQMAELRKEVGKGGRKTKKNKSSKRKTHGRRV